MLEKIDLSKNLTKKEFSKMKDQLFAQLAFLQREAKALGIPVIIVFEGWGAAGKGTLINRLIQPLDPRGFSVYTTEKETEQESMHPFLWRFWTKTPAKGRITIFDRSWYRRVLNDRFDGITTEEQVGRAFDEITAFERQLTDDGNVMIKFFLHISKKEQKKRFERLLESKDTSWRVTKADLKRNKHYEEYLKVADTMLEKTDTEFAKWSVIEATDREFAAAKIMSIVIAHLQDEINRRKNQKTEERVLPVGLPYESIIKTDLLGGVDLSLKLDKEEYKSRLQAAQEKLSRLHNDMYLKRMPVILAFEGWDAGGKGGAIKRITECIDPRGYQVNPTASPNDIEKAHHYLWRFWETIPKDGHMAIYDRTWYGRVMVERIEGFCREEEWKRAYREINEMEEHIYNEGCLILKFWMHIDSDEQERRFKERMETPEKQWKITDEDWRNREKWSEYEEAVNEMILRTSTTYAPWIIVEANDKYFARVKVIETVVEALTKALKAIK